MTGIVSVDLLLLERINRHWTSPWLDWFFPIWTDFHKDLLFKAVFVPLLLLVVFYYRRWAGLLFILATAAVVGLCDGFCGKVLKQIFERPRPSVAGVDVILRAPHFGGFSFPSNHAANMFCLLAFAGFFFPRLRPVLLVIAVLTAYSRVYCGVHYPSDVIGGAIIGFCWGILCSRFFQPLWIKIQQRQQGVGSWRKP